MTGRTSRWALPIFLLIAVGGGLLIGSQNIPGEWYRALQKPFFNPPDWLFGPVWTVLYGMIGIAGWRAWKLKDKTALWLWAAQMALNFAWSPTFFTANKILAAAVISTAMLAAIALFMLRMWRSDRLAGWLFAPYGAWVAFATILNISIWWLNP